MEWMVVDLSCVMVDRNARRIMGATQREEAEKPTSRRVASSEQSDFPVSSLANRVRKRAGSPAEASSMFKTDRGSWTAKRRPSSTRAAERNGEAKRAQGGGGVCYPGQGDAHMFDFNMRGELSDFTGLITGANDRDLCARRRWNSVSRGWDREPFHSTRTRLFSALAPHGCPAGQRVLFPITITIRGMKSNHEHPSIPSPPARHSTTSRACPRKLPQRGTLRTTHPKNEQSNLSNLVPVQYHSWH